MGLGEKTSKPKPAKPKEPSKDEELDLAGILNQR